MVIMGRKTYESLPKKKPLPGRHNVILTRNKDLQPEGFTVCHSIPEVLELIKEEKEEAPFIIGGANIYHSFLPYCELGYITKLKGVYEADTKLDSLDNMENWVEVESGPVLKSSKGPEYQFTIYKQQK